jgi:hypothetical protein
MGIISAKQISGALAKAQNVGLEEEAVTLGNCALVLRSLRPDEYAAVLHECAGLEDIDYLYAYQKGHVARSIVEINGFDLRGADFVEVEEDDPKRPGEVRKVKLELHAYVRKHVIDTWGREAIVTAYRKFGDVVKLADDSSRKGVKFIIPDETPDEKYRRLLAEMREIEDEVPPSLLNSILDEHGLVRKSTVEEVKAAMAKADELAREQEAKQAAAATPAVVPEPIVTPPPVAAPIPTQASTPEDIMARRVPLNRQPIPVDPHQALQERVAQAQAQQNNLSSPVLTKAAQIAALEADAGLGLHPDLQRGAGVPVMPSLPPPPSREEVPELRSRGQEATDPEAFKAILEQPPAAGINPRFKPPAQRF